MARQHQRFLESVPGIGALLGLILLMEGGIATVRSSVNIEHQRLLPKNTFKSPDEVVRYYCARDASGFVWSGLLEIERRNFTLWNEVPQTDSFYIAKSYEVGKPKIQGEQASVPVTYQLVGVGDAFGTKNPPKITPYQVTFNLVKQSGSWKIRSPDSGEIAPVVVEEKFPYAR
jgi:hypothetical protein